MRTFKFGKQAISTLSLSAFILCAFSLSFSTSVQAEAIRLRCTRGFKYKNAKDSTIKFCRDDDRKTFYKVKSDSSGGRKSPVIISEDQWNHKVKAVNRTLATIEKKMKRFNGKVGKKRGCSIAYYVNREVFLMCGGKLLKGAKGNSRGQMRELKKKEDKDEWFESWRNAFDMASK